MRWMTSPGHDPPATRPGRKPVGVILAAGLGAVALALASISAVATSREMALLFTVADPEPGHALPFVFLWGLDAVALLAACGAVFVFVLTPRQLVAPRWTWAGRTAIAMPCLAAVASLALLKWSTRY